MARVYRVWDFKTGMLLYNIFRFERQQSEIEESLYFAKRIKSTNQKKQKRKELEFKENLARTAIVFPRQFQHAYEDAKSKKLQPEADGEAAQLFPSSSSAPSNYFSVFFSQQKWRISNH